MISDKERKIKREDKFIRRFGYFKKKGIIIHMIFIGSMCGLLNCLIRIFMDFLFENSNIIELLTLNYLKDSFINSFILGLIISFVFWYQNNKVYNEIIERRKNLE